MSKVYIICGLPGSGKTWCAEQIKDRFIYLPHDIYKVDEYSKIIIQEAKKSSSLPVLAELPFRISVVLDELLKKGLLIIPIFIIEPEWKVRLRYFEREGRTCPTLSSRFIRIKELANKYGVFSGTSDEVLEYLINLDL